jgi:hypothetical protein
VVSQHDRRPLAEATHVAQHLERLGPTVHEVADEPEAVARSREADLVNQLLELVEAPLDVADRVRGHDALPSLADARHRSYAWRSPLAIGVRTARMAGKMPPQKPIASA